jgi:hypothetical protein
MTSKTLTLPEDVVINMLKTLHEDTLLDIFWQTLVESDISPLTLEEKEAIEQGKNDFNKRETIKWADLSKIEFTQLAVKDYKRYL